MITIRVVAAAFVAVCLLYHPTAHAQSGGTDILHLTISTGLSGPTGNGTVFADHKQQGRAEKQTLAIEVTGLAADTTYVVLVTTVAETNPVAVAELTTDATGAAALRYSKKGQGKGPKLGLPLPPVLDPVSALRHLEISQGATQTMLAADLAAPDKLQYLVKRALSREGTDEDARGGLRIKSNGRTEQFRLRASGLDAGAAYGLVLNEAVADWYVSDAGGRLGIDQLPAGAPSLLEIFEVALIDSATNRVLSTSLP
jgi:hypothetical protein